MRCFEWFSFDEAEQQVHFLKTRTPRSRVTQRISVLSRARSTCPRADTVSSGPILEEAMVCDCDNPGQFLSHQVTTNSMILGSNKNNPILDPEVIIRN